MVEEVQIITKQKDSSKNSKLILGILFDLIGMISYIVPLFAEVIDVVWAPISGLLLVAMYKGTTGKVAGVIGFIEELLPGVDFIPTFTITWIYQYVIKREE